MIIQLVAFIIKLLCYLNKITFLQETGADLAPLNHSFGQ